MSPEQIAQVEELNVEAVKALLFANSGRYREMVKGPTLKQSLDLTEENEALANRVFVQLAEMSDDDNIRLKAAMRIKDERRGRLDIRAGFKGMQININVLNEHFAKAAAALAPKFQTKQQTITDV